MIEFFNNNIEHVSKILSRPKYHYEVCYQYWTLARITNRFIAILIWWFYNIKFKNACCLVTFADNHYIETIRPKIIQNS